MSKSDTADARFSGLFLKFQEDLWALGMVEMGSERGLDLSKVTQQVGGNVRLPIQVSNHP